MKSGKSVALIYDNLTIKGGAGNVTMWLANRLAARGVTTTVFTTSFNRSLWPEPLLTGFSVRVLPAFSSNFLTKRSSALKRLLCGAYLSRALVGYDVLIPHNNPAIQWVQIAKKLNAALGKVLWFCHEPTRHLFGTVTDPHLFNYEKYGNGNGSTEHIAAAVRRYQETMKRKARKRARNARWEIEAASTASTVVTNSYFCARNIERVFSRSAEVVYPGILSIGNGQSASRELEQRTYIGSVGRLSVRKNIHNVIEAFGILRNKGIADGLSLKIVGEGPERSVLEKKVIDAGLHDRVSFLGQLTDEQLSEFYANARMIVYTPIDEPFGLVPLESLYHETPVIVSDHGGPAEILTHEKTAYVVNPFDPKSIAEAMARCMQNEHEARQLAENGCALVKSSFTFDRFVDHMEHLF